MGIPVDPSHINHARERGESGKKKKVVQAESHTQRFEKYRS